MVGRNKPRYSVNDEIQDRTIRHMVFLERYKSSEVFRIVSILNNEIIPEIEDKIEKQIKRIKERGSDVGVTSLNRLRDLEKELRKLTAGLSERLKKAMGDDTLDLTKHEIDWQAQTIEKALGFELDFVMPSARAVAKLINTTSFAGLTIDQWYNSLTNATQRNVMMAVNRGIVEGETTEQIMRRIRGSKAMGYTDGVWQTTRNQAEAITRTVINHTSNQSRLEFFKENSDLIDALKWVSTLDSRTSVTCAALDGKVFPVDKGPRPPAHPNCRSGMTAVLKSADELGLKDLPEGKRSSMNGQVPASTTYGEWLKKQPVSVQEEVLGVTKAKLFRDGGLPIERFTDSNLKPLTLDQLRTLEKNAFTKAGIDV